MCYKSDLDHDAMCVWRRNHQLTSRPCICPPVLVFQLLANVAERWLKEQVILSLV